MAILARNVKLKIVTFGVDPMGIFHDNYVCKFTMGATIFKPIQYEMQLLMKKLNKNFIFGWFAWPQSLYDLIFIFFKRSCQDFLSQNFMLKDIEIFYKVKLRIRQT